LSKVLGHNNRLYRFESKTNPLAYYFASTTSWFGTKKIPIRRKIAIHLNHGFPISNG
jgi:hypothetical protein